jgi:hypothetical protein
MQGHATALYKTVSTKTKKCNATSNNQKIKYQERHRQQPPTTQENKDNKNDNQITISQNKKNPDD